MTDPYANIRRALEMGPTPGPWKAYDPSESGWIDITNAPYATPLCYAVPCSDYLYDAELDCKRLVSRAHETPANAAHISACDPDTIRELLAERDDLLENGKQAIRWAPSSAHWSNELKRLFGDDARLGIDALESQLRNAQVERDALRDALETIAAYPYSRDQEMGATAMRKVALDALAAQPAAATEAPSDENGGHRLVEPDHETALALADAPRSLRNYVAALQAENERLRAEVAEWKRVAAAQAELHGEAEERAKRLAERDALARDAARYRWLRDPCSGAERVVLYSRGDFGRGLMSHTMLDAAIDAALAGKGAAK